MGAAGKQTFLMKVTMNKICAVQKWVEFMYEVVRMNSLFTLRNKPTKRLRLTSSLLESFSAS